MSDNAEYKRNRHSCYDLKYHFVVVTKYRHPVLVGKLKERLKELTIRIFEQDWKCNILSMNTDKDHIHIMFEAPPQVQLSKLVNNYKNVTARYIRKEFIEELKPWYWKPVFWSDSYFICTVSERSEAQVRKYIESQGMPANPA